MSTPAPTFGQLCAETCRQAAKTAREAGGALQWEQVAALIDEADKARKPLPASKQSKSGPFGDRKGIPPTPEQVTLYSASIGYPLDGQGWCDFYAAKGWMVGKTKMKDWQAAVRNWARSGWGNELRAPGAEPQPVIQKDYTKL